ncbi:Lipin/Ned1/Smp2-domain-containing protein [Multifurca ochricompacta]|uniref:Lipin/Ned1/Smp2-domain-containing protein n=1 Tax=Multifurca ochricompacta TaxID=376703 RepID=A0AAD4QR51_9AGAM|nr:Lipin/Ned1/Smp2-domain-containing protein [Multifurca ochricompacta]
MNYLWGAVSAISVPYQYYKDINPATLTGAIDVIVIRRPGLNGTMELVCSPFHVRFGKWQVLRPTEKKVDIAVNGKVVPFHMKIGEAGEAFFVFETDGDVPDDLITSPLLEPTQPVLSDPLPLGNIGRFGAPDCKGDFADDAMSQEPDFLDLDAPSTSPPRDTATSSVSSDISHTLPGASLPHATILSNPEDGTMPWSVKAGKGTLQKAHYNSLSPGPAPSDDYSWEWGGFPQRSQIRVQYPTLPIPAPLRSVNNAETNEHLATGKPDEFQRSKSLPPEFDLPERSSSTLQQTHEQFHRREPLSDVETVYGHGMGTSGQERKSWVRWWRRDNGHVQSVDARVLHPTLKSVASAPFPGEVQRATSIDVSTLEERAREPSVLLLPMSLQTPTSGPSPPVERQKGGPKVRYAKTLRLTSEQLQALDLQPGANTITFSLSSSGVVACAARIFMWEHTDSVVVSDIDGTITKSDALGHMLTLIGRDWTHLGVAKLYTDIYKNGYKIMYLTSRAIGQADSTRYYLQGIKQNDYQLPEGPVIMSPDRLMASLHREVIMRKPEVFKMACLRDIQRLFRPVAPLPFYAGFGNRITDALSYRSVNIPSSRIFTIDSNGEVKMELLDLLGTNLSISVQSYIHMTDLKWESEFTDNNYWKSPLLEFPLPDLTPPSPALSARSDTSNQSAFARLRNFSLRSTSSSRSRSFVPSSPMDTRRGRDMDTTGAHSHQRQLSSIERLSNALVGLASRSVSPSTPSAHGSEKRSTRSMPGSLPGSRPSSDEEDLEFGVTEKDADDPASEQVTDAIEQEFDDDLFAAGEMQKVPFL